MLRGEGTRSRGSGFEGSIRQPLEIGSAIDVTPSVEERHLHATCPCRIERLTEYRIRAPLNLAEERWMRMVHPDQVIATIRSWTKHDSMARPVQHSQRVSNESWWKVRQIGTDDDNRFHPETERVLEHVGQALAQIASALRDHIDGRVSKFTHSLTLACRLTGDDRLHAGHRGDDIKRIEKQSLP